MMKFNSNNKQQNNRMKYLVILFGLISCNLSAQIITDRPDQTESSSTIPMGALQVEAGVGVTNLELTNFRQIVAPTVLLRYGITKGFELRLFNQVELVSSDFLEEDIFGLGDLEFGFKGQLLRKEDVNTEIAVMSHLIVPSGSEGLSIESVGVINKISISHTLNETLSLGYNLGYDKIGEAPGAGTYSVALGIGLSEKWGAYAEPYGSISSNDLQEHNFDAGVTYLVNDNLQLDLSSGMSYNYEMNYVALGFSWVTKGN